MSRSLAESQRRLRAVEPGAFLLPGHLMRRLLRHTRGYSGWFVPLPRRKVLLVPSEVLLRCISRGELGLDPGARLPALCFAIRAADPGILGQRSQAQALRRLWRELFHARVLASLERRAFTQAEVRERIAAVGQTAFDEVRGVLGAEGWLLPVESDRTVWATFAAVFLELRHFAPEELPHIFPTVDEHDGWAAIFERDLDVRSLIERSNIEGAARESERTGEGDGIEAVVAEGVGQKAREARPLAHDRHLARAERAAALGNAVRALLERMRAADCAGPGGAARLRADAHQDLRRLAQRLGRALAWSESDVDAWVRSLAAVLPRAMRPFWTPEARFLYDLQKVCIDAERGVRGTSLLGWVKSLGQRPIERDLPLLADALIARSLRRARARLVRLRLAEPDFRTLEKSLDQEVHRSEERLRRRVRPIMEREARFAGFTSRALPERIGLERLIDELLDKLVHDGQLSFSQIRDAVARNEVKLPRCDGPRAFWRDRLLRLDRALARALDGIYRPAEFYLRWLHRGAALLFGTHLGRWLSLFLLLPFGGAWVAITGIYRSVSPHHHHAALPELEALPGGLEGPPPPPPVEAPGAFATWLEPRLDTLTLGLGAFVLGLLFIPDVRRGVWRVLRRLGLALRWLFADLPVQFLGWAPIRRLLRTRLARLLRRVVIVPALIVAVPLAPIGLFFGGFAAVRDLFVALFIMTAAALNTRPGIAALEVSGDWLARTWNRIRSQLLMGIVRWFVDIFAGLLGALERGLYEVDERLRFREGESKTALYAKAGLNFIWSGVSYLIRFYIVLLVEPQVNPIKHFPVVTVSHKLILPILPALTQAFAGILEPVFGQILAWAIAGANIFLLPGVFGFLAWELKENWRLFEINRPQDLRPQIIGSHGETMTRFLKPGFHSGTLPRAYRKLRRAGLDGRGDRALPRRSRDAIHHVEEAVGRFVERDLVRMLRASRNWSGLPVTLQAVHARSNCIHVELAGGVHATEPLVLSFEQHNGLLIAGILERGWIDELDVPQRRVLRNALIGHYHHAGVAIVREEIEARLGKPRPAYDLSRQGLVVWPGPGYERELVYDLESGIGRSAEGEDLALSDTRAPRKRRSLETFSLRFDRTRLPWARWLEVWEDDQDEALELREIGGGRILPDL